MPIQSLRRLQQIIDTSIRDIESRFEAAGLTELPSASEPYDVDNPTEKFLHEDETVNGSVMVLTAACDQLVKSLTNPEYSMRSMIFTGFINHPIICMMEQVHMVEILREAGPKGMHVSEIAKVCGINEKKLAHALRLLATQHMFREVSPDVFANNRVSSSMDTGKTVKEIVALKSPSDKYAGTNGLSAICGMSGDILHPFVRAVPETWTDPETAHSELLTTTAYNRVMNTDKPFFDWLELPENKERLAQFGAAMRANGTSVDPHLLANSIGLADLPKDSLVVDIGGGIGAKMLTISRVLPHLRYYIHDRPEVEAEFRKFWSVQSPKFLEEGRVNFRAVDFFSPQPSQDVAIYFLCAVLHDWPDKDAIHVLKCIRQGSTPSTRLIWRDVVLPYACKTTSSHGALVNVPEEILPNLGNANVFGYCIDIMMHANFNAKERTLDECRELAEQSGWKLLDLKRDGNSTMGYLVLAPA